MLFYLTSNDKVNLLDFVETQIGIPPKKMTGKFSLLQFVIRDMRNYAHIRYFVIDRSAANEDDDAFVEAVNSFKMMFSARIIIICEAYSQDDSFVRQLIMSGVTDIVTADDIELIQAEILECLSPDGMQRFKVIEAEPPAPTINITRNDAEDQYSFTAKNVRVAVAGCQRRNGVTTTAANLAHWIEAHGGTACYFESNENHHLAYIVKLYGEQAVKNHYSIGGVDYYFTDELDKYYNFIITDCGILNAPIQSSFINAELRLLCSPAMPYELPYLQTALDLCKGMIINTLGMYVPLDIRELIQEATEDDMLFMAPSHELFDGTVNGDIHRLLLDGYITNSHKETAMAQRF